MSDSVTTRATPDALVSGCRRVCAAAHVLVVGHPPATEIAVRVAGLPFRELAVAVQVVVFVVCQCETLIAEVVLAPREVEEHPHSGHLAAVFAESLVSCHCIGGGTQSRFVRPTYPFSAPPRATPDSATSLAATALPVGLTPFLCGLCTDTFGV